MKTLILSLLLALPLSADLSTTVVWEVRPTNGLDTNGGCFDSLVTSPGTDFSQQNALQNAYTDLVAPSTMTITSVARPFSSVDPGNCIHIASGTGWTTGWYEILSVSGVTATVDRAIATAASTGGTGTYGGALQTIGQLNTNMGNQLNNTGWVKAESAISTTGIGITTGSAGYASINGYTSVRGDGGVVTVQASTANVQIFTFSPNGQNQFVFANFKADCNSHGNCGGFLVSCYQCILENLQSVGQSNSNGGFNMGGGNGEVCHFCFATGGSGSTAAFMVTSAGGRCWFCVATGNATTGFAISGGSCFFCISGNNSGSSSDGFTLTSNNGAVGVYYSVSYNNGRDGIRDSTSGNGSVTIYNSILASNVGYGINSSTAKPIAWSVFNSNAFYNNTLGARNNNRAGPNDITLTGDPFTNGAGNVYSLNATAGAGGALRGAATPGALLVGGTSYADVGPLQHQPTAGGGTFVSPIIQ